MKRKVIALLVICVMVLSGCGKTTPEEKSEETVQDIQQKEIADDFEELMEGTRELYEKVAENKLLDSLEFQKQVIGYLGQKGYAAVDMKDQVDMVHSEQVETYCEKAKRGESADVVIYSVIEQGGVVRYELHTDGDDMDAIVSTVRWTDNKPCMIYYHKFKVHSWKYTEKGYFFIEEYHPPGFDGPPGEKGFRVKPLDRQLRELNQKYVLPIGYRLNNMLIINWKEEDYSDLNFYDLYELKYPSIYGKEIPYAMKEGAEYQIPKEEFESVLQTLFPITSEQIQKNAVYNPDTQSYRYRPRGLHDCELEADTVSVNRSKYGTNKVTHEKKKSLAKRVAGAFINPFTAILFCLAFVSTITDMIFPYFSLFGSVPEDFDFLTVVIILTMVFISGTLRFVQESRSGNAAEKLLAMITTTCTVTRIGQEKTEIPMDDLVVGDIVHLSAGDMIPADVRILDAKDLFVSQASLTGESEPIEKLPHVSPHKDSVTDYTNIAFMGSNVISGSATAVVICVGDHTLFGSMAAAVAGEAVETSFTKGVNAVSWVLIRFMLVMVPLVFFVNGITKGDWLEAFLFGISIAVGLTPEMLPMIVTTCLAKGAVSMSKKQTIVKNLNSIQNFGAMDILCTDKTGTLTQDKVVLEYHLNVNGEDDTRVLRHAYLNSYFQTGYKNLMDLAIIHKTEEMEAADKRLIDLSETYVKVDEIPFDSIKDTDQSV